MLVHAGHRVGADGTAVLEHGDLVGDPEAQSRRLYEFCGLQWSPQAIDPSATVGKAVNTLSTVQVRSAINTRSIGRWKPYARWLEPMRELLDAGSSGS
jgi:hypothetical protein